MIYKTGHTDDPKEYNTQVCEGKIKWGGCISSKACTECGTINTDSICLCGGNFTCVECGFKNGIDYSKFKFIDSTQSIPLYIFGEYPQLYELPICTEVAVLLRKEEYYGSY